MNSYNWSPDSNYLSYQEDLLYRREEERLSQTDLMTLGEVAATLERFDPDQAIRFEDWTTPGDIESYRGYYRFVAIERGRNTTVGKFLAEVKSAIGKTFTGYKGGEYKMTRMTPVWVSEHGEVSGDGLVGVKTEANDVVLVVAHLGG